MRERTPTLPAMPQDGLWPFRGEFVDPAIEREFRKNTLALVVSQQRIGLLAWALVLLALTIPDYVALGTTPVFWLLTAYRAVISGLLLLYMYVLRRAPALALHSHVFFWLGMLAYPYFFLFYAVRPDALAFNTAVIMLLQLSMFLFIPIRVMITVPVAVFGAVGATFSVWLIGTVDTATTVLNVFLVTIPIVVGYVGALRLQKTERQQFWLRQQLQDANRELHNEVERRVALLVELQHQAATDILTGLPNRRTFVARFATESARAQRSGEALSLAMFDLDHFKRVNDKYGHATGDAVLRSLGSLCNRSFREVDTAARVGGEEFAVLLPSANLEQAAAIVERFASALADMEVKAEAQSVRVTATVGVAQHRPGEDLQSLMARADAALYAGKQAGRNRVVLAQ